ncbi:MAG: restriction endonuclease subunit S, partial [Alistipes sp.]|nr:restriction endonuclease subunit S [Alistipes sp.]
MDSDYFYKKNLQMQKLIESMNTVAIGDIGVVTDGIHTSIDYDENSGINLISATSPRENVFNLTRNAFISEKAHTANPRTALRENDVVLSTVGTVGNCAVVDETILPANSDRHVGIIRLKSTIDPYVLSTFLLSKYGRNQTVRETTGNVQPNLFLYKIKEIKVPVFDEKFQDAVRKAVVCGRQLLKESKQLYSEAGLILTKEIGMDMASLPEGGVSVKSFAESFGSTGRLDAEYYQKRYDIINNILTSYKNGYCRLKDIIDDYATGYALK